MSKPVAIVTGACSGMGLGLTKHLLTKKYHVIVADINQEAGDKLVQELGADTEFHACDVSSWDSNAALFKDVWQKYNRIDFFAANAGVGDTVGLTQSAPSDGDEPPPKPDMAMFEINFYSVVYGVRLFVHYARKTRQVHGEKIVPRMGVTASSAGIYGVPAMPSYASAKAGVVNLVRSVGKLLKKENEGITLNAVCPGFVLTALNAPVAAGWPKEHITPLETVVKGYDCMLTDPNISGEIMECSKDIVYFTKQSEFVDASMRFCADEGFDHLKKTMPHLFGLSAEEN